MVHLTDIGPLTGFLRDHKAHLERLAATGRPEVLTVNGKARVVIQDAEAYQKMLEALDAAETERIVRERLAALDRDEAPGVPGSPGSPGAKAGIPADQVLADVRKRLGIKRK